MLKVTILCLALLANVSGRSLDQTIDNLFDGFPPDINQKIGTKPRPVLQGAVPVRPNPLLQQNSPGGQGAVPLQPQFPSAAGFQGVPPNQGGQGAVPVQSQFAHPPGFQGVPPNQGGQGPVPLQPQYPPPQYPPPQGFPPNQGGQGAVPLQPQYPPPQGFQGAPSQQGAVPIQSQSAFRPQGPPPNLPPGDYRWGEWSPMGPCSATCGKGQKTRRRTCFRYELNPQVASSGTRVLYACVGPDKTETACTAETACRTFAVPPAVPPTGFSSPPETQPTTTTPPRIETVPPVETLPPVEFVPAIGGGLSPDEFVPAIGGFPSAEIVPPIKVGLQVIPPINCYSSWGEYGSCSADCGPAFRIRARECSCPACDEPVTEIDPCVGLPPCGPVTILPLLTTTTPTPPLPVITSTTSTTKQTIPLLVLTWSEWSEWSGCRAPCGVEATESRVRFCTNAPTCEGSSRDTRDCPVALCLPVKPDPTWGDWGPYTQCVETCGPATKSRVRTCSGSGQCLGDSIEITSCNNPPCATLPPVPRWNDWGEYSLCSQTCGAASKSRVRTCSVSGACSGDAVEVTFCDNPECPTIPTIPKWNEWGPFSVCVQTCGPSTKSRLRTCSVSGQCFGNAVEFQPCNNSPCPALPPRPNWSEWGPYSLCDRSCGPATKTRVRTCSVTGQCQGEAVDTTSCNNVPCTTTIRRPPTWTPWSLYGDCSHTCGPAQKLRIRTCSIPDRCFGESRQFADCKNELCSPPSVSNDLGNWGDYSPWSDCERKVDGNGCSQTRYRPCVGGLRCEGFSFDYRSCSFGPCAAQPKSSPTTTTNKNQQACDASRPEQRRDCGYPGISREDCWLKGCCYSDTVYEVSWCFYDDFSGVQTQEQGRLDGLVEEDRA